MNDSEKILAIFEDAQRSAATHRSALARLERIVSAERSGAMAFILNNVLPHVLVVSKKEPKVERVIEFLSKFFASCDQTNLQEFMEFILMASGVSDKTVRARACQIAAGVVTAISDAEKEISAAIVEAIETALIRRLRDKIPAVRVWAVRAVGVLQNPEDSKDKVTLELLRLLSSDSSKDVRVAAVELIAVSKSTLSALVDSIKDVSKEVRIAAFERLTQSVDIRHLRVPMRAAVVQYGLKDREAAVRVTAIKLIFKWLVALDNDVPKLLSLLGLHSNEAEAVMLATAVLSDVEKSIDGMPELQQLFRESSPDWQNCSFASLNSGDLLWTQVRCDFYTSDELKKKMSRGTVADIIERLRPDTTRICEILSAGYKETAALGEKSVQNQLMLKYLLRIATGNLDIDDIVGCTALKAATQEFLLDWSQCPSSILEPAFSAWAKASVALAGGNTSATTLSSNAADVISADTATIVSTLWSTDGVPEEEADDEVMSKQLRAIEIATFSLQLMISLCGNTEKPSGLSEWCLKCALTALQSPLEDLRMAAVRCLGLVGLSCDEVVKTIWTILLEVGLQSSESDVTRCWAVQGLCDLTLAHSQAAHSADTRLVSLITRSIEQAEQSALLSRVACEAGAKLLFSGSTSSPRLFGALLKSFFSDDSADNDEEEDSSDSSLGGKARVQQMLGVFFHAFYRAGRGRENVIVDCMADFIAEYSLSNGETATADLSRVLSYLLSLIDDDGGDKEVSLQYRKNICSVSMACIFRECLKCAHSYADKRNLKDFVKSIGDLYSDSWIDSSYQVRASAT
jgi:hypothetical protein